MDVVFLGPGYPGEMPLFTRGLAEVGATVIGVGDQPHDALPELSRRALADYIQIGSWGDEDGIMRTVLDRLRGRNVDLVETLWEPTVVARGSPPRGDRHAGHERRAGVGVPRQGPDEGDRRASRHPDATCRAVDDGCRLPRGRGAHRLPADHQADLRRRFARHVSRRERRRARGRTAAPRPHRRGQRRGVHRRRGVHVRHRVRRRFDRLLQHRRVPAAAARRQAGRVDQPAGHRPSPPGPPVPGGRQGDG